jgi:hypothetical protein
MLEEETGELIERRLEHENGEGSFGLASIRRGEDCVHAGQHCNLSHDYVSTDLNHDGFKDFSFINTSYSNAHTFVASLAVSPLGSQNKIWGRGAAAPALCAGVRIGPAGLFSRPGAELSLGRGFS